MSATIRRVRAIAVMTAGLTAVEPARQRTIVQEAWCAWEEVAAAAPHVTTRRVRATVVMPAEPTAMEPAPQMTIVQEAWCAWAMHAVAATPATTRRVRAIAPMLAAARAPAAATPPRAPATKFAHAWEHVQTPPAPATIPAPANSSPAEEGRFRVLPIFVMTEVIR
jgi:hypothetical protein